MMVELMVELMIEFMICMGFLAVGVNYAEQIRARYNQAKIWIKNKLPRKEVSFVHHDD